MRTRNNLILSALFFGALASCQEPEPLKQTDQQIVKGEDQLSITIPQALLDYRAAHPKNARTSGISDEEEIKIMMNETLFKEGKLKVEEVKLYKYVDRYDSVNTLDSQFESTISSRWVPGDTRRNWNGDGDLDDIDWSSFTPFSSANGTIDAEPIYAAMFDKWENDGYCTTVAIDEMPYTLDMGNPSQIIDVGLPNYGPYTDISVVGYLPASIFESVLGSENTLGVTFSFVFQDENGTATSTTRGKTDKAFSEIWFNDGYRWSKGGTSNSIDIESVVLHEFGHALNLGHFGILQAKYENGVRELVYQPVNTMNALYIGEKRSFLGENDKGNYCEAWGSWPWN
ncbi:matrixin family metalloprotease [Fulvivirga sediminis]|uniref:Peptidase M10 metallopeptidase domain-containing protein n=1 Tax=Fulvivirga sediminis TaxID=2803949 RepID=A0A937F8G3_9BACT|nr:matrixin family metalloprotease [Fulvivirga sediminis]MBL3655908.1 hypothetical protein [Fulvivirga sediminis]